VYSLVRFYPEFWGDERTEAAERLGLARSLQTLVHEVGHLFGVHHCQTYQCVMNGCNSLRESDTRPIHLCPECLKKFRWNIGFDVMARYETLKAFYETHDMKAEAEWIEKRLRECRGTINAGKTLPEPPPGEGATPSRNPAPGAP
jgi:archaemetzincin